MRSLPRSLTLSSGWSVLLILASVLLAASCGHGDGDLDGTIGAACASDGDCDVRCYTGGDFPGGFCSRPCQSDRDCTVDAYCTSNSGGVCMFACPPVDCGRLGQDWVCRERSHISGGNVFVCIGD